MSLSQANIPQRQTHPRAGLILTLILCAEIMDLLDSTIVNVAAPSIALELHSTTTALQWVTGGYSLSFAAFLIAGARLGDQFGRRTLFIIGAWGFVAFSALCAFAPDTSFLVAGRLLQGASAALLVPQGLSLLQAAFSPKDQGKAFGIFGPVVGLAAVAGPVLGGVLVSADLFGTGWRMVFLINLPIGIFIAIAGLRILPESRSTTAPRLDVFGTALVAAAIALIVYPLIQGREAGWPAWTYAAFGAGIVVLGVFILWILDRVVDGYGPVVAGLSNDIDEIETQVFAGDTEASRRIYDLNREVIEFQRAARPLIHVVRSLIAGFEKYRTDEELQRYLRDVEDHLTLVVEQIDELRHLLRNILTVNATLVAQKQNDEMKRLSELGLHQNDEVKRISSWAAILFAPTLVGTIYGMNFDSMPELHWRYGYYIALGAMVLGGVVLYAIFRHKRWL